MQDAVENPNLLFIPEIVLSSELLHLEAAEYFFKQILVA
jgi:hypothetical protein